MVDGDDVLDREDRHHQELKAEADADRGEDHNDQTAEEGAEQRKETADDRVAGEEDVEGAEDRFDHQVLEVEDVSNDPEKLGKRCVLLFGGDEDKDENGCRDGKDDAENAENSSRSHCTAKRVAVGEIIHHVSVPPNVIIKLPNKEDTFYILL